MLEGFKCRHLSFGSEGAVFTALEQVSKSSALSASLLGAHLGPRLTLEGWAPFLPLKKSLLFPSRGQGLWIHPRLRRIWLGPGRKRPPRLRLLEKPTEDLKRANRPGPFQSLPLRRNEKSRVGRWLALLQKLTGSHDQMHPSKSASVPATSVSACRLLPFGSHGSAHPSKAQAPLTSRIKAPLPYPIPPAPRRAHAR